MDQEKKLLESLMQPDVLAEATRVYLENLLEMECDAVLRKEFGVYLAEEEADEKDDDDKEDDAEDKTKPEDDEDEPEDEEDDKEEK